jgi:hypothetical protein
MLFDRRLADARSKIGRHEAERRDAQALRHELELGRAAHRVSQRACEPHVVGDHRAIARRADLAQRQPHLQRAEAARVLRPVVDVVGRALLEVVVGRMIGERRAQLFGVAHQRASRLERRVEPFVRIDRDRVGVAKGDQVVRRIGRRGREAAVGAVDMEPGAALPACDGDRREIVDRSGAHRSRGADNDARPIAGGHVGVHRAAQRIDVHSQIGAGRNPADRGRAEPAQVGCFLNPRVRFGGSVDA